MGGFGAKPGHKRVPKKVPGKVLGGFGVEMTGQFNRVPMLWCRVNSVPEKATEKVWEALVQSQGGRLWRRPGRLWWRARVQWGFGEENPGGFGAEPGFRRRFQRMFRRKVLEKVWEGWAHTHIEFNTVPEKILEKVAEKVPEEVLRKKTK